MEGKIYLEKEELEKILSDYFGFVISLKQINQGRDCIYPIDDNLKISQE